LSTKTTTTTKRRFLIEIVPLSDKQEDCNCGPFSTYFFSKGQFCQQNNNNKQQTTTTKRKFLIVSVPLSNEQEDCNRSPYSKLMIVCVVCKLNTF
jgi:hypothetical protein